MQILKIQKINFKDQTFRYSHQLENSELEESIKKSGILNPIILFDNKIVSGFRRFHIAKKLNFKTVPVYLKDGGPIELFLEYLIENTATRNLEETEKATIISKVLRNFKANDVILKNVCRLLKISFSEYSLQKYLQIADIDEQLQEVMFLKKIKPESAIALSKIPPKYKNQILKIIDKLRINQNISMEIIENLKDIYKKDAKLLNNFMKNIDNMNVDEIRQNLKNIKFPELTKKEQEFEKIEKLLKNKNLNIKNFPYFEKEEYEVILKFTSLKELKDWIIMQNDKLK